MLKTTVRAFGYAPMSSLLNVEESPEDDTSGSNPLYFFQRRRFSPLRFNVRSRSQLIFFERSKCNRTIRFSA